MVSQIRSELFRERITPVVGSKKSIVDLGRFSLVPELWRAGKKPNFSERSGGSYNCYLIGSIDGFKA